MLPFVNAGLLVAAGAGLTGAAFFCPLCGGNVQAAGVVAQASDTATVRLHICVAT